MPGKYQVTPRGKGTSPQQQAEWRQRHGQPVDLESHQETILAVVEAVSAAESFNPDIYDRIVRHLAREGHPILPKAVIRRGYLALIEAGIAPRNDLVLQRLQMKPTRTQSGVAPVTVLTEPHPCPGSCVFCPNDVRMPKSYLSNEPGAMRALMLDFDPYVQTAERIKALRKIGHTVDKIELLILGGTWSCYPHDYQEWFVRRCFDAMNTVDSPSLDEAHRRNENAPHRNVGLVIETRPDHISVDEVHRLRRLGVTRVQLGVQSLDDRLLDLNKRGHTANDARRAIRLLRSSGFKIAIHWMPNLLGASPESDLADFETLWSDPALRPDELKIYPTGLIRGTELHDHFERGDYQPYDEETLIDLLAACKKLVPPYCRINRLMRDIPAPEIAEGVTTSNLRQIVQQRLKSEGTPCRCIRCREVRREPVDAESVRIEPVVYPTDHSREVFLQALTDEDRLAGFLRLSLPISPAPIAEIDGQAIIRQVQVYGPVVGIEAESGQRAQHRGLGTQLIEEAHIWARGHGCEKMAVIAAVGTREYYRRQGFELGDLYMSKEL